MAFSRSRGLKILAAAAVALLLGAGVGALAFYLAFVRDLPDLRSVDDYRPPLASRVVDRNGIPIGEYFVERRRLTPLESVPTHVVQAFVAGEDSSFFEHGGIDYTSIVRAAWKNLAAGGEIKQGGSTITQQMVKGLLLSPERTYRRKIREMILARDIEQRFTKNEILYLYLNQIYFGHGAYGIGDAAHTYFGKSVSALSVSEGAQLAGLPKAPSRYSPYADPEQADIRRTYVLERMLADGFIDQQTYEMALADAPVLRESRSGEDFEAAAYFTEEVRRYLFEELGGHLVLNGGLLVETSLDLELQKTAVAGVREGLVDLDRRQGYRGPVRLVDASEIEAELTRLSEENGLREPAEAEPALPVDPVDEVLAEVATEAEAETLEAELEGEVIEVPLVLPDGPLLGVVTEVDAKAERALVGLAPGVEAVVHLRDVSWAREPDPKAAPRRVRSIDGVFAVGEVARFVAVRPEAADDAEADEPAGELHVTLYQEPQVEGALLSIDLATGDVLAMVGGYDFARSQFNRATQARRQPGSAFKPLIYAAAIATGGYTPASILWDRPVVYVDKTSGFTWRPRNYGRSFYGPITLRQSLVRSVNNSTVHLFRDVGVSFVIDYVRRLGIESPLNRDLSLALGSSDVTLLELTRAYAVFPNRGRRVTPRFIRRVTDRDGNVLMENVALGTVPLDEADLLDEPDWVDVAASPEEIEEAFEAASLEGGGREQLVSTEEAFLVTDLLRAVVVDPKGTGWRLRALRRPVAGKTGTTNDQADAWFMGFSPEIVTGVWVGHDESRVLGWGETGSRAAAPIWVEFMKAALEELPVRDFGVPESIVFARIDRKTGLLADASSQDTVFQAFLSGTEPTESASTARTTSEGRRLLRMDAF